MLKNIKLYTFFQKLLPNKQLFVKIMAILFATISILQINFMISDHILLLSILARFE